MTSAAICGHTSATRLGCTGDDAPAGEAMAWVCHHVVIIISAPAVLIQHLPCTLVALLQALMVIL